MGKTPENWGKVVNIGQSIIFLFREACPFASAD
jgi:hypothetical protein